MVTEPISPADERSYLAFDFQASKGTDVAPAYFLAFVDAIDFDAGQQTQEVREAGSAQVIARHNKTHYTPQARGSIAARPDIGAALFAAFLGSSGAPAGGGDPFTHTITPAVATPWLSLERNIADDAGLIERFIDTTILELEVDIAKRDDTPEPMLVATFEGLTPERQTGGATADTYEVDRPFIRSDATWTIDSVAETAIESANLRFRWIVDTSVLADGLTRAHLPRLRLECDIEMVQLLEKETDAERYRATNYGAIAGTDPAENVLRGDFDVELDHSQGGAAFPPGGALNRQLKITVPAVDWITAVIDNPNPTATEVTRLRRTGRLVKNTAGANVTVTAINGRSTAYVS